MPAGSKDVRLPPRYSPVCVTEGSGEKTQVASLLFKIQLI